MLQSSLKFQLKFNDKIVPLETLECPDISLDSTETTVSMKHQLIKRDLNNVEAILSVITYLTRYCYCYLKN